MFNRDGIKLLGIKYPIIQAPMAGGITTSQLVAAVSNAGGLGMIGAGYMKPEEIKKRIREVENLTSKPFGINLFVPEENQIIDDELSAANEVLQHYRRELNIESPQFTQKKEDHYEKQLSTILEEGVPICSFTFGIPSVKTIKELKARNIIVIGTATTVQEAVEIENKGLDAVVAQGSEAGGHRGTFMSDPKDSMIGLMSLVPQIQDHVSIPIIAAGGIMDDRGVMASFCLGAQAVQMGTAFLTCIESGAHPLHKEAIFNSKENDTVLTRAFSGKYARGISNRFTREMEDHQHQLLDYPLQNTLTKDIRRAAAEQNNPEFMSLWSGQSPRLSKKQTVQELIENIMDKCNLSN